LNVRTGIAPLDERAGGLRRGALYLLAGASGAGRFAFLLQFLDRGLKDGERVALLCHSPPEQVFEQADSWGIDLRTPWSEDRLVLIGYRDAYPERALHSPDPAELFAELGRLVGSPVSRLAIDSGTQLWEARKDSSMAGTFVTWAGELGATIVAAVPIELDERQRGPTEWVAQRARGVLQVTSGPRGLYEIEIVRLSPPLAGRGPITLELAPGLGLVRPGDQVERRKPGRPQSEGLLLLDLAGAVPADLQGWLDRSYVVEPAADSRDCVGRIRTGGHGALCVYTNRARIREAIETGRRARPLTDAVLMLLSDESLRASDAARALDAGFDDVLSGVVDLRELESRFRRAEQLPKARQEPEIENRIVFEAPLEPDAFRDMVTERLIAEGLDHFSLLHFDDAQGDEIGSLLFRNVRAGGGDVVGPMRHGWGVLLQGARAQQAEAFLQRLRAAVAESGGSFPLSAEILAAPEQSERIRVLLGA
jgi:hypothetical protein